MRTGRGTVILLAATLLELIMVNPSDWTQAQSLDVVDVDQAIYDRINKKYGTNHEMRMKKFFEQQKAKGE